MTEPTTETRRVETSQGRIFVVLRPGRGIPLLLLHGNSLSGEVFEHQFSGLQGRSLIAPDLLGHGRSDDAVDPSRSYSLAQHAAVVAEALATLGVENFAAFGHSLGGHIALELTLLVQGLRGLILQGTPPFAKSIEGLGAAFTSDPRGLLGTRGPLSETELVDFADAATGDGAQANRWVALIRRTDPNARRRLGETMLEPGARDQRELAEGTELPIMLINGALDPVVNLEHCASLRLRNPWSRQQMLVEGAGHAPMLTAPGIVNPLIEAFLDRVAAPT